mmetsp:Transcript_26282/g.72308  ORF Transcript_26282/g.72308 Transcript_26282/m.72308 type:complete len:83 (-) Transcript_26282:140-388(-)|eukprot:scaffold179176_cov35-Tisochrysis_lutea.AAC.4
MSRESTSREIKRSTESSAAAKKRQNIDWWPPSGQERGAVASMNMLWQPIVALYGPTCPHKLHKDHIHHHAGSERCVHNCSHT